MWATVPLVLQQGVEAELGTVYKAKAQFTERVLSFCGTSPDVVVKAWHGASALAGSPHMTSSSPIVNFYKNRHS